MATPLRFSGADPDTLFEPLGAHLPDPQDTDVRIAGQDARLRYAPVALGSAIAFDTRMASKGRDWRFWFAARGSVSLGLVGVDGRSILVMDAALTNQPTVSATAQFSIRNDGTWHFTGNTTRGPANISAPASGNWLPPGGTVGAYQVQFDVAHTGEGSILNSAPVWQDCTDSRSAGITLPSVSAANADFHEGRLDVRVRIRLLATQQVISDSTCSLRVETYGWA